MIKYIKFFLIFFIMLLLNINKTCAGDDRLSIGFGYPYISLKYYISEQCSGELRGAVGNKVSVYGVRAYYYYVKSAWNLGEVSRMHLRQAGYHFGKRKDFFPDVVNPFLGIELDFVSFDKDNIDGNGFVVYPYIGAEIAINNKLKLITDMGAAYITLKETEYDLSVGGIEWLINFGFNYVIF